MLVRTRRLDRIDIELHDPLRCGGLRFGKSISFSGRDRLHSRQYLRSGRPNVEAGCSRPPADLPSRSTVKVSYFSVPGVLLSISRIRMRMSLQSTYICVCARQPHAKLEIPSRSYKFSARSVHLEYGDLNK